MLSHLIRFSLVQRLMILLLSICLIALGIWSFTTLPIDAFPEISPPQVQVIVKAPGMSPTEVESRITSIIEMEMQGLPRQEVLRSTTKYALSIIIIDFEDGTDIYWARQQVAERLNLIWADLPNGVEGGLGPITTPLGEGYMYRVEGKGYDLKELRRIQDWIIRPRLRTVDGVADINSLGGEVKTFEVIPNPESLLSYRISLRDLESSLNKNNSNAGGDRINRNNEVLLVQTIGQLKNINDIENITIRIINGVPIHISDVAEVKVSSLTRYGAVTADGKGEIVTGLVLLRTGANSRKTIAAVKLKIKELQTELPQGVHLVPFYDRTDLVNTAISTIKSALVQGVLLVLLVLVTMLGNIRAALTVALILPLSVLFTFILMKLFGVSANLMTLGGLSIAIGMLVDSAVVVVENIHTKLNNAPVGVSKRHLIYRATLEVATPVVTGVLIIIIVFLPLFSLTGLEGKMFTPLAITISFALIGSLILSLTVIPVLASFLMSNLDEKESTLLKGLHSVYLPLMHWALNYRKTAVIGAFILLVFSGGIFNKIGREFLPIMDEGTTVVIIEKLPSISLERSLELDVPYQKAMMELPEVIGVVARTGADELRMDPMGLYQTDNFLITKPKSEWKISLEEFQNNLREKLDEFIGIDYAFTQPIDMRVSEMLTGVRAAMAIKLYGEELDQLEKYSKEIESLVNTTKGAVDVFRGQLSGQIYLQIDINQQATSRFGINVSDINELIEIAVGGRVVTKVRKGNQRIGVLLRYPEKDRISTKSIGQILIDNPLNQTKIPLNSLVTISEIDGPVAISRESAKRQVIIQSNVEGRDVVGFVNEVRKSIESKLKLPSGYYVTYGGQFENQQRASQRITFVIPIVISLIFLILFLTFNSLRQASLIILNIPFAMIGGVFSLYYSGLYLSVPASIGFITLFGVAILNGVVMVTYFNQLRTAGNTVRDAVIEGSKRRLRPVLMTAVTSFIGLLPLLYATGPGSEIQKPLAIVVIGGLVTSTILTLILLPTIYIWLEDTSDLRDKGNI